MEEALANAVYHRGYDVREPIEVQVTETEITITSYPGPDPSVRMDRLNGGGVVARRYRNRRVGEFLKELRLTEGRGTGVPSMFKAMLDNGSPVPSFETDENRTYFTTVIPIHPLALEGAEYVAEVEAGVRNESDAIALLRADPRRWEVLRVTRTPQSRRNIQEQLGLRDTVNFRKLYLNPLVEAGLVAPTIPNKPNSPHQQYVITERGGSLLAADLDAG